MTAPATTEQATTELATTEPAATDQPSSAGQPVLRDYRRAGDRPAGHHTLLDLLEERLTDYRATVHRASATALPATLAEVLAATLPPSGLLLVPPGLPAEWLPAAWLRADGLPAEGLPPADGDRVVHDDGHLSSTDLDRFDAVLTACAAAAAETGTIALDGSPGQGRRALSLIPDRHICVVRADQVVQTVPELVARLVPDRPLTLISGPSATSDIELHRVEGVHGPRTLVVVIVDRA